jgi:hypothetical protein
MGNFSLLSGQLRSMRGWLGEHERGKGPRSVFMRTLVAGWVALCLLSTPPMAPAAADSSSCGSLANYFAGMYVASNNNAFMNSSKADITRAAMALCNANHSSNNFSTSWAMIAQLGSKGGDGGYAQVGYFHEASNAGVYTHFYEWRKYSSLEFQIDLYDLIGLYSVDTFQVKRQSGCSTPSGHCLAMLVNGSPRGSDPYTGFDPHVQWDFSDSQFYSEVTFPGSDVNGLVDHKAHFTGVTEEDGGSAVHEAWIKSADCSQYHALAVSTYTSFDTWTDPFLHGSGC